VKNRASDFLIAQEGDEVNKNDATQETTCRALPPTPTWHYKRAVT